MFFSLQIKKLKFLKKKRNLNSKRNLVNTATKKYQFFYNANIFFFLKQNLHIIINLKQLISGHFLNFLKDQYGVFQLIKSTHGNLTGDCIKNLFFPLKFSKILFIGSSINLHFLPLFSIVSNLQNFLKLIKTKYAAAPGTYIQIVDINHNFNLNTIKLPSGIKKFFHNYSICTIGRNNNIFFKYSVIGKAGVYKNLGKKPSVRGVAKNPVDHPHGGRTKTVQPEVSPWG